MDGIGIQVALVGALVLLNAAFDGTEFAMISLRPGQLTRLERSSRTGEKLAALARQPNRFLSTVQLGSTLVGFLASATAAVTLAEPLVEPLSFLGRSARPAAVVLVTMALTFVVLVVGQLAPKRVALQHAEGWALVAARPLAAMARVVTPVIWLLSKSTDLAVRLVGSDPHVQREQVTAQEIREMVATGELYAPEQRRIITGALELTDRTLRQVLVPRTDVLALPASMPVEEALRTLVQAGHSRAPVYRDRFDDADRVVVVLGLIGREGTVGDHATEATILPESLPVTEALRQLQHDRRQMALVVSEYGGLEGIATVEDLVEELVGEIYDEHDRDVHEAVRLGDGSIEVPGRFPVHDLPDLGYDVPETEAVTVAGLMAEALGRLPRTGDEATTGEVALTALSVRRRTVERVRLRAAIPPGPDPGMDEPPSRDEQDPEPDGPTSA